MVGEIEKFAQKLQFGFQFDFSRERIYLKTLNS